MRKINFTFFALLLIYQTSFAIDFYKGNYQQALAKSKIENKPLFLYFTATWCGPCVYMQQYIFPDTILSTYVKQNYIALKLDIDTQEGKMLYHKTHQIKGSTGVPAFIIMNNNEEVLKKELGGMKLQQLKSFLMIDENQKVIYKILADSIAKKQINVNDKKPTTLSKLFYNARASKWKPGIKLGTNLMSLNSKSNTIGFEGGLFFDFNPENKGDIKKGFWHYSRYHFQPGLLLNSKNNLNYLTVELFNGYQIKGLKGLELTASPYASLNLNKNDFSYSDYGLRTGIGKQFGTFQANIGYNIGLQDIANLNIPKAFNRGFYFIIGMTIGK